MAKALEAWTVYPHNPIEKITENLWRVEGSLPKGPLRRVMTCVRLNDGRVVIHNAIALHADAMAKLEAWGRPSFLLVPNGYHRLDAKLFKQRYPSMVVLCPKGATARVAQVVAVDGGYEDFPGDPNVSLSTLSGVGEQEGVMKILSSDGLTLVFNDALFNMPHGDGLLGWILRHVTQSSGGPKVSRIFRTFMLKDKAAFLHHMEELIAVDNLRRILVSHHHMIQENPAETVREALRTALS